ncbi:hypothetical protein QFZ27_000243 [Inquilinus ginsengisoli]|uniref:hypothetical protein n=1 Tax=Inquilinus ginsengisoli TaxID=363840 RepID=UPI003D1C5757
MAISDAELDVLVKITGTFEASGDPYVGVSGDFDGQGISCGVLQWNIGQNSLQPLVNAVGKDEVVADMPTLGAAMWDACNGPIPAALRTVRSWQNGTVLKAVPKRELQSLMGSAKMRAEQNAGIRRVGQKAETLADTWASDRGTGRRTVHELAWFFDVVTQNGSMKDLAFRDVTSFKNAAGDGKADDLVCDWLAGTDSRFAGMVDCHKNAPLWRNNASGLALDLLVLAYLRSQKSTLRWRGDVLNRKGTLATKGGWVHRQKFDLSGIL